MIEPTKRPVTPWRALLGVWLEPGATFEGLRERMPILLPYLVQMAIGVPVAIISARASTNLSQSFMAGQPVPPGFDAAMKTASMVGGLLSGLAMPWLTGVVVAGLATFFGQFQSTRVPFGTYLGLVGYARLPVVVGTVVQAFLTLSATTMAELTTKSVSLAVLLPADASPYLRGALSTLNPFVIWYYVILTIGLATLHRAKPSKTWSLAATLFAVSLLLATVGGGLGTTMIQQTQVK
ncbi:MAG: Yip1 family protein [Mycobacterium leprae]